MSCIFIQKKKKKIENEAFLSSFDFFFAKFLLFSIRIICANSSYDVQDDVIL